MWSPDFDRTADFLRERRAELERSAATARMLRSLDRANRIPSLLDRALARMGRLLVTTGSRLERRAPGHTTVYTPSRRLTAQ